MTADDDQVGWRYIVTAPKNGERVLAWSANWEAPCTAEFNGYKEWCVHGQPFKYQPTHWMPLPEPPTDREQSGNCENALKTGSENG